MVSFPDHQGLRPTGDRMRETLFSWLQTSLPGSRCLDMFAGSGVLGFEAISRGAAEVLLVEKSAAVAKELKASCSLLEVQNARVECGDVTRMALTVGTDSRGFNIVFIDPPFDAGLHAVAVQVLAERGVLCKDALVSIESDRRMPPVSVPDNWVLWREKHTRNAGLQLYRVNCTFAGPQ